MERDWREDVREEGLETGKIDKNGKVRVKRKGKKD